MKNYRKIAKYTGILFIVAFVMDIIGMSIHEPILGSADFLNTAHLSDTKATIGILIDFLSIPAIIMIPIVLYPVLKKQNESLALGYVVFRLLEGAVFVLTILNLHSLLNLSRENATAVSDTSYLHSLGEATQANGDWITLVYVLVFSMGAMILYSLLYASKLVPRLISIWGLTAVVGMFIGALVAIFGDYEPTKIMAFLGPPVALNEMTLAGWLIIKGFNTNRLKR